MPALGPFTPGATATLAVTTSTGNVSLGRKGGDQMRVCNIAGGQIAFVKFGTSAVTAAVTDLPILPGTAEIFSVPRDATHVAAITSTSTATLYVTSGDGQ